ncbi:unnamed protein product [Moneuplotes crassus]|uniref:Thioredoxin domain-containing protein n=1 Tax=Euplotes crassus TaxID=5936 RepID=A0AAD1UPD3_EUPCR|nr:unnamed protein product [Moneuplotes crassus]
MKVLILFLVFAVWTTSAQVIQAKDEADMYRINDEYPARYSVVIYKGEGETWLSWFESYLFETKHQQEMRELDQIIDFFEKNPYYEIPVIEVDVDKADFTESIMNFGVESVPWIIILDENNDEVYSSAPVPEADEEILVAMNIFTSTITPPPSDDDDIDFGIDFEEIFRDEPDDVMPAMIAPADSNDKVGEGFFQPEEANEGSIGGTSSEAENIEEAPVFEEAPILATSTSSSTVQSEKPASSKPSTTSEIVIPTTAVSASSTPFSQLSNTAQENASGIAQQVKQQAQQKAQAAQQKVQDIQQKLQDTQEQNSQTIQQTAQESLQASKQFAEQQAQAIQDQAKAAKQAAQQKAQAALQQQVQSAKQKAQDAQSSLQQQAQDFQQMIQQQGGQQLGGKVQQAQQQIQQQLQQKFQNSPRRR